MSRMLRRHYAFEGEHHTVHLEEKADLLRARIDQEDAESAHFLNARLVRALPGGAELRVAPGGRAVVVRAGDRVHVAMGGRTYVLDVVSDRPGGDGPAALGDDPFAASPMTGVVLSVLVAPGATVAAGTTLCVVEAMKMEFAVEAPRDVVLDDVKCAVGDRVDIGQVLVTFREDDAA